MFQPFSVSESTIRYTAQSGIVPWILVANPPDFQRLCRVYQEVAAGGRPQARPGRERRRVPRRALRQAPRPRPSKLLRDTNYAGFKNYFGGFGFWEAFRTPEDAAKYPLEPYTPLPPSEWTVDRMRKVKYALAGTVDQVKAEIEALHKIGGDGDLEWFGWFFDQGFMSLGRGDASDRAVRQAHHPGVPLADRPIQRAAGRFFSSGSVRPAAPSRRLDASLFSAARLARPSRDGGRSARTPR